MIDEGSEWKATKNNFKEQEGRTLITDETHENYMQFETDEEGNLQKGTQVIGVDEGHRIAEGDADLDSKVIKSVKIGDKELKVGNQFAIRTTEKAKVNGLEVTPGKGATAQVEADAVTVRNNTKKEQSFVIKKKDGTVIKTNIKEGEVIKGTKKDGKYSYVKIHQDGTVETLESSPVEDKTNKEKIAKNNQGPEGSEEKKSKSLLGMLKDKMGLTSPSDSEEGSGHKMASNQSAGGHNQDHEHDQSPDDHKRMSSGSASGGGSDEASLNHLKQSAQHNGEIFNSHSAPNGAIGKQLATSAVNTIVLGLGKIIQDYEVCLAKVRINEAAMKNTENVNTKDGVYSNVESRTKCKDDAWKQVGESWAPATAAALMTFVTISPIYKFFSGLFSSPITRVIIGTIDVTIDVLNVAFSELTWSSAVKRVHDMENACDDATLGASSGKQNPSCHQEFQIKISMESPLFPDAPRGRQLTKKEMLAQIRKRRSHVQGLLGNMLALSKVALPQGFMVNSALAQKSGGTGSSEFNMKMCVSKRYAMDPTCRCAGNNSCAQLDPKKLAPALSGDPDINKTFSVLNQFTRGKIGAGDMLKIDFLQTAKNLLKKEETMKAQILPKMAQSKKKSEREIAQQVAKPQGILKKVDQLSASAQGLFKSFMSEMSVFKIQKDRMDKVKTGMTNKKLGNISQKFMAMETHASKDSTSSLAQIKKESEKKVVVAEVEQKSRMPAEDAALNEKLNKMQAKMMEKAFKYQSVEKDKSKSIWKILSIRYFRHQELWGKGK